MLYNITIAERGGLLVIYIDVLLAVNLYINYFIIRGAALILRKNISTRRCLLSAFLGALMSMVILLPDLPFWLCAIIRAVSSIILVYAAFGASEKKEIVINIMIFLLISFIYAGLMMAVWMLWAPFGMFCRNGSVYFDIPLVTIGILTAIAFALVRAVNYIIYRRKIFTAVKEISIFSQGHEVTLEGIADTGNSLFDPFSGKPAIICNIDNIIPVVPPDIVSYLQGDISTVTRLRLLPYSTIMGESLIPVFRADKIVIGNKSVDAVVGVCNRPIGAKCLFNPELISL